MKLDTMEKMQEVRDRMARCTTQEEADAVAAEYGMAPPINQREYAYLFPTVLPAGWRCLDYMGAHGTVYRSISLTVIMSVGNHLDGKRWLHVSLARRDRIPYYTDMVEVKELFIGPEKKAIQIFPPRSEHVNINEHVLHLWHCIDDDPLPDFTQGSGSI
jgi:hypothetical protein